MRIQLACCLPRKSCSNFSDLFNIVTPFFHKVVTLWLGRKGSWLLGFAFLYKDFPLEDFCFEFQYKERASKVRQTEGGEGTLSGVLTQQRAEQISSCIISSSICSCLQKGLSVGVDGVAVLCKSRVEQGRGQGGFVIVVVVVAWPLGFPASLSQALFINQIKFIWPPAAAPLSPHTHTPTAMLILCLSEARRKKGGKEGEGAAARSRRCQLPIS